METQKKKMRVLILGHLLGLKDLKEIFPGGKILYKFSLGRKLMEWALTLKDFSVLSKFDVLGETDGYFVAVRLTAKQMMGLPKEEVRKKILNAILYSQNELGCDVVMLGALTAPLTSAGAWLQEQEGLTISITNGNTYTVAIAIKVTEQAIELAGLDLSRIKIAIVGSAGVIGEGITKYFDDKNANLILIERSLDRFDRLELHGDNHVLTDNLSDMKEADIVITATSHPDTLITSEILKKNAIVVDVAEPPDVSPEIEKTRPDVICIDGGRVNWEKIDLKTNFGLPKKIGFACMTEGLMQALENRKGDYVGSVTQEHLKETMEWGEKWNFPPAAFTSFNKPLDLKRFNKNNQ